MKIIFDKLIGIEILRYLVSGGSAAVINITTLYILVHYLHVWFIFAAIISYSVAIFVSFLMHKLFTFNDRTRGRMTHQTSMHVGLQVFNICVNTILMYVLVDSLRIHYILSQVLSGAFIALYSFLIYKHLVFNSNDILE